MTVLTDLLNHPGVISIGGTIEHIVTGCQCEASDSDECDCQNAVWFTRRYRTNDDEAAT